MRSDREDQIFIHPDVHHVVLPNPNFSKQFAAQKNDVDRVDWAYRILEKYNWFTKLVEDDKCDSQALKDRQNGNREFGKGSYREALDYYTQSIGRAKTGDVLALGYGNRSASLYKLNLYKECIEDIDRGCAISNCPVELKEKLRKRRTAAEGLLEPVEPFHEDIPTIPNDEKNPHIQCARNCVKIETNEKFGRHIVATRDIQIGEIISVEKPYVCTLICHKFVHCHHCMELCYNPLPCDNCTQAYYCREECRATALDLYHKYECPIYVTLRTLGSASLVLRIAILFKSWDDHSLEFESTDEYYSSDRYKEMHRLELHSKERPLNDLMLKSFIVAELFQQMESHTTFFQSGNPKNDIKEILMRSLLSFQINGYRIYENSSDPLGFFADSVYSFASLFSHSCCHNIVGVNYGSTLVTKAVNTIKSGQQCCVNYGPGYTTASREVRHESQKRRYFFTCQCRACKEDWKRGNANFIISLQGKTVKEKREEVREVLPHYIQHLKFCEKLEPCGFSLPLKTMISDCFKCLGNERQF